MSKSVIDFECVGYWAVLCLCSCGAIMESTEEDYKSAVFFGLVVSWLLLVRAAREDV